jgi:hypothetical protein
MRTQHVNASLTGEGGPGYRSHTQVCTGTRCLAINARTALLSDDLSELLLPPQILNPKS